MSARLIQVEVAYARPERQRVIALRVPEGTTLYQAVVLSHIVEEFPDLDLTTAAMGVFGKWEKEPQQRVLCEGERAEIYRPLVNDPKEARKARAARVRASKQDNL